MLFKLKQGEDIKETNNGIDAIPEFERLTSKQMFVVALVADYDSPLRKMPEKQRRERSCLLAGYPLEDGKRLDKNGRDIVLGKIKNIEEGIAKYRELQYDEEKDMIVAYDNLIKKALEVMNSEKQEDLDQGIKASKQLPDIREARKLIQEKIVTRDYKPEIETFTSNDLEDDDLEDENLSLVDRVMQKQKKDG